MASHDPKDTTSVDAPVPDYEAAVNRGVKGSPIGIPKEYRVPGMAAEIDALWEQGVKWLEAAGAKINEGEPAAHQICAALLLYCRAGGGLVEPRPL